MYSFSPSPSPAPASPPPNSHLYSPGGANHPNKSGGGGGAGPSNGAGGGGAGVGGGPGVSNAGQSHAAQQQRYSLLSKLQQAPHGHYGQHHASHPPSLSSGSRLDRALTILLHTCVSENSSRSAVLLRRRIPTDRTLTTPLPSPRTLNTTLPLTSRTASPRQVAIKVHLLRPRIIT
jgi:hypothetical protein